MCRRGVDEAGPLATVFILFTQHTVCQLTLAGLKVGTGSGPGLQKPAAEGPGVFIWYEDRSWVESRLAMKESARSKRKRRLPGRVLDLESGPFRTSPGNLYLSCLSHTVRFGGGWLRGQM